MRHLFTSFRVGVLFALVVACSVDTIPEGLRRTPEGDGPVVRFDTAHRPLPEIPLPNDVATFPDPTSRTGLRLDVSIVAGTRMEQRARQDFGSMEGWGTSAPITVSFARGAAADPREPALDLADVEQRMAGDEHDPANDPAYVIDLTTGLPVILDVGAGYYPIALRDTGRYFEGDPKAAQQNLSFESVEEGAGLTQSAYTPALDTDFDGVLDHPNGIGRPRPGIPGVDDVISWYERETDTLIMRPVVPLEEKREYAVVLTDRLRSAAGAPVKSPFDFVHHPGQRASIAKLRSVLQDPSRAGYYGDIAGTGLDRVAFAWTFTTQPTHEDLRFLRDGLYGKGPFARFAEDFTPKLRARPVVGRSPYGEAPSAGWQDAAACKVPARRPYLLKLSAPDVRASFRTLLPQVLGLPPGQAAALDAALEHVDHVVLGSYRSPFLLGDPKSAGPDTRFTIDFKTGEGDVRADDVDFVLMVPKETPGHPQPFPVAIWGHGVTSNSAEAFVFGGDYARQGVALFAFNAPQHGLALSPTAAQVASAALLDTCLVPFVGALLDSRARDLTGDGVADSGFTWWTSHLFHTRDNVRQAALDAMQAVRALRMFDGRLADQDYDVDGAVNVAGDFDGNGKPDVGGPGVPYYAAGVSLGGIMSGIEGGIEPFIVAAAPVSGGGGFSMDIGVRSYGVSESVASQMLGPFVVALPASERPDRGRQDAPATRCGDGQRTLRLVVNDGTRVQELEVACLSAAELDAGKTVVVLNTTSGATRCARTAENGRFGIPIPTTTGDRLDVQVYDAPDAVVSYEGCVALPGAPIGRRVQTWEVDASFRGRLYPTGDTLLAPNEGLGLRRQSPELRRFRDLGQAAVDPADPVNFAPYYMLRPLLDENGIPAPAHALLNVTTVGDNFVPVSAGLSFARAAGGVPFLPPSALAKTPAYADYVTPPALYEALGRRTPMRYLVDTHVAEGIARLGRTSAGPSCASNTRVVPGVCPAAGPSTDPACSQALFDVDWVSEGALPYDQPRAPVPLRLGRIAGLRVDGAASLDASWEPRLRGTPFAPDEGAWSARAPVIATHQAYLEPGGRHTWDVGDVCRAWDFATYGNALMARFFATQGRDVYYLSHPGSHACLASGTCPFFSR